MVNLVVLVVNLVVNLLLNLDILCIAPHKWSVLNNGGFTPMGQPAPRCRLGHLQHVVL